MVLAGTVGSVAAAVHAGPGKFPVGIEINATHHRSARQWRDGHGHAAVDRADAVVVLIDIVDDDGRRCAPRG